MMASRRIGGHRGGAVKMEQSPVQQFFYRNRGLGLWSGQQSSAGSLGRSYRDLYILPAR